jgi:ketosteroid isomerase-like protein
MSQAVDLVRDQFEKANRREYVAAGEQFSDDIELVVPPTGFLNGGVFSGREAVGRWFTDWFSTFSDSAHFDLRELVDAGDSVVVVAHHTARGGASGVETEADLFYGFRLRDGKISRVEFHATRDEARAAAGLPGESDIDRVRRGYSLFNDGDFAALVELFHPDVVMELSSGRELVGREGLIAFWEPDAFEWQKIEPEEIRQHGDRVFVRIRVRARGRGSAIELDQPGYQVWTVRDGLAVRLFDTFDEEKALEAFYGR